MSALFTRFTPKAVTLRQRINQRISQCAPQEAGWLATSGHEPLTKEGNQ